MDISVEKYKSDGNHQSNPFLAALWSVSNLVGKLIGFFTFTEEERTKAGISLGGEGRDYG